MKGAVSYLEGLGFKNVNGFLQIDDTTYTTICKREVTRNYRIVEKYCTVALEYKSLTYEDEVVEILPSIIQAGAMDHVDALYETLDILVFPGTKIGFAVKLIDNILSLMPPSEPKYVTRVEETYNIIRWSIVE